MKKILFLTAFCLAFGLVPVAGAVDCNMTCINGCDTLTGFCKSAPQPSTIKLNVSLDGSESGKKISTEGGAIGIMKQYVGKIYIFGSALVFIIAVIMLIIGGFEMMFKSGSGDISTGKDRIVQALLGIVLVALSALILNFVNPTFFVFN